MLRLRSTRSPRCVFVLGTVALAAALGVGQLWGRAAEFGGKFGLTIPQTATAKAESAKSPSRAIRGVVLDLDGKPATGVVIVAGLTDTAASNHQVFVTDSEGRFTWPLPEGMFSISLFAHKTGRAATVWSQWLDAGKTEGPIKLKLGEPEAFTAVVVDSQNQPIAGARVRVEMAAHNFETKHAVGGSSYGTAFTYFRREVLGGSPLDQLFVTTTDEHGAFTFHAFGPDLWLRLAVTNPDGREMRVKARTRAVAGIGQRMDEMGFVKAPAGEETRLVTIPAARVQGRVVTKLVGVSVAGLNVWFQATRARKNGPTYMSNFRGVTRTDAEGRFTFDGLEDGTINIYTSGGEPDSSWTYRAAQDVELKSGWTRTALIELIRGVEVEGKVLDQTTGRPIQGAEIGVYGPFRPRSSAATEDAKTDAKGRYHYRLPPGETYFYVMGSPPGYARGPDKESSRTLTIPGGATRFEVPPILLVPAVTVRGRITDAAGGPVAGATVIGVCENGRCIPFGGADRVTDSQGTFQLPPNPRRIVPIGQAARLRIRLRDGSELEVTAVPTDDGSLTVKLPVPDKNR